MGERSVRRAAAGGWADRPWSHGVVATRGRALRGVSSSRAFVEGVCSVRRRWRRGARIAGWDRLVQRFTPEGPPDATTTASSSRSPGRRSERRDAVVPDNMDALEWPRKHLEAGGSNLLREMVRTFAERLMAAEVEVLCNAGYGEVTPERTNSRNGYRSRQLDSRVGSADLSIPKLREGSYFPGWLLEPRRRAERAGGGGGRVLRAGCQHAARRGSGADPGHRVAVEVPGVPDGRRARQRGGGVPGSAPRWRPLHLCVARRHDPEGP
jgi:hypothetical protein